MFNAKNLMTTLSLFNLFGKNTPTIPHVDLQDRYQPWKRRRGGGTRFSHRLRKHHFGTFSPPKPLPRPKW